MRQWVIGLIAGLLFSWGAPLKAQILYGQQNKKPVKPVAINCPVIPCGIGSYGNNENACKQAEVRKYLRQPRNNGHR